MSEIMIIPADPRYPLEKQPLITNEMKSELIGEFSWEEEANYYDENGNLIEFTATRIVPWSLCKEIYKKMSIVASQQSIDDHEFIKTAEYRCVPFARIGMRVEVSGKSGVIAGKNSSASFDILFDGHDAPMNCHPNWDIKYFDSEGNLLAEYTGN